jgi:hypothetical protein
MHIKKLKKTHTHPQFQSENRINDGYSYGHLNQSKIKDEPSTTENFNIQIKA